MQSGEGNVNGGIERPGTLWNGAETAVQMWSCTTVAGVMEECMCGRECGSGGWGLAGGLVQCEKNDFSHLGSLLQQQA